MKLPLIHVSMQPRVKILNNNVSVSIKSLFYFKTIDETFNQIES